MNDLDLNAQELEESEEYDPEDYSEKQEPNEK